MQAPNRPGGPSGYSVRNYAPATVFSHYPASQCASSTKPPPGKSFTIDALLARTEETRSSRGSLAPAADRYYPAAPPVPLGGRGGVAAAPAPYLCSPPALHPASHLQAGYSLYCCPPLSYQPTCRGAFYAQASLCKVNTGTHSFKTKGGKSKRVRTSFTSEQLSRLEKEFARQQYMVGSERFLLASALQLTEAQVKVWFQNRRIKWRKQSLEQQQAKLAKLGLAAPPKSPGSQGHGDEGDGEFSDLDVDVDVDVDVSDDSAEHC